MWFWTLTVGTVLAVVLGLAAAGLFIGCAAFIVWGMPSDLMLLVGRGIGCTVFTTVFLFTLCAAWFD